MWRLLQERPSHTTDDDQTEAVLSVTPLNLRVFLLQEIFLFITRQLKGLEDTKSPQFNRYFYLLEVWCSFFGLQRLIKWGEICK